MSFGLSLTKYLIAHISFRAEFQGQSNLKSPTGKRLIMPIVGQAEYKFIIISRSKVMA